MPRYGFKPDTNKFQDIMNLGRPTTTTEAQALVGMVQYYRDVWTMWYHILALLTEVAIGPKVRKILWNDTLEESFK